MFWRVFAVFALGGVVALSWVYAPLIAQQSAPAQINGCVYTSSTVTLTNLQSHAFLCDVNGRLKVTTTP